MDILEEIALGNNRTVLQWLESNSDLSAKDEYGAGPLHIALASNNLEIIKPLIEQGFDLDLQDGAGKTILHYLAEDPDLYGFAQTLPLDNRSMQIEDTYGNTPLWSAVFNARGRYDLVKHYLQAGGDINKKNKHQKSPLDFAQQINDEPLIAILLGKV